MFTKYSKSLPTRNSEERHSKLHLAKTNRTIPNVKPSVIRIAVFVLDVSLLLVPLILRRKGNCSIYKDMFFLRHSLKCAVVPCSRTGAFKGQSIPFEAFQLFLYKGWIHRQCHLTLWPLCFLLCFVINQFKHFNSIMDIY